MFNENANLIGAVQAYLNRLGSVEEIAAQYFVATDDILKLLQPTAPPDDVKVQIEDLPK